MTLFRRVLLFVGIAWSIAGAFQLLSSGGPWLLDRAVKAAWIPDGLVAPRPQQPVDCSAAVQGIQTRELDETTLSRTRVAAYQLGFDLGLFSGARNAGSGVQEPPSLLQERDRLARELAVPLPAIPPLRQLANALHEFEVYVAADPECIGARLSAGYTREHDALYRFGAFVGHSVTYRGMAPEVGPLFVPALRRYGQAAGLPERVWRPLAETSSQKAGPQAWAEGSAIADGILAHLRGEAASDVSGDGR
jgi:hypothetical protein